MTPQITGWLTSLLTDTHREPAVHFHSGPDSAPAACHNPRCEAPQLDVSSRT